MASDRGKVAPEQASEKGNAAGTGDKADDRPGRSGLSIYVDRFVARGLERNEATAIACWMLFGRDLGADLRDLAAQADRFEDAARRANEYHLRWTALGGVQRDEVQELMQLGIVHVDWMEACEAIAQLIGEPPATVLGLDSHAWDLLRQLRDGVQQAAIVPMPPQQLGSILGLMGELAVALERWALRARLDIARFGSVRRRGRPSADHLKRLCARAAKEGLTAVQLARAAVVHRSIVGKRMNLEEDLRTAGMPTTDESVAEGDDAPAGHLARRLQDAQDEVIEKLRKRLQGHWPKEEPE